ncbi:MAG: hypothetical protein MZV64_44805 [Ignavibacteriales bacterium]|nr:hypothetical protein [Ignavibacteriales bacterium]
MVGRPAARRARRSASSRGRESPCRTRRAQGTSAIERVGFRAGSRAYFAAVFWSICGTNTKYGVSPCRLARRTQARRCPVHRGSSRRRRSPSGRRPSSAAVRTRASAASAPCARVRATATRSSSSSPGAGWRDTSCPTALESDRAAFQPVLLRDLQALLHEARSVAVVAAADRDEVLAPCDLRCICGVGRGDARNQREDGDEALTRTCKHVFLPCVWRNLCACHSIRRATGLDWHGSMGEAELSR